MSPTAVLHVITDAHIHTDCLAASPDLSFASSWGGYRAFVPGVTPAATRTALASFGDDARYRFGAALHPWYLEEREPEDAELDLIADLLGRPGVCAVGETGLDRLRFRGDPEGEARAERWFGAQVALAVDHRVPLVIHCVRRHGAVIDVLGRYAGSGLRGMVHAFAGSIEVARAYRRLGFVVGIGPLATRPQARRLRESVQALHEQDFTLETDAPFMATGERTPGYGVASDILDVADAVAELRSVPREDIIEQSARVWLDLFDG